VTQRRQKAVVDARSTLAAIPVTQSSLRRHSIQYFARGGEQGQGKLLGTDALRLVMLARCGSLKLVR